MGVATFADGRIAHKRFVSMSDDTATSGSFKGYSTYTFENSDSVTVSYVGAWDATGMRGDYTVLSGTGKFVALLAPAPSQVSMNLGTMPICLTSR